jgi:hypothetical protein
MKSNVKIWTIVSLILLAGCSQDSSSQSSPSTPSSSQETSTSVSSQGTSSSSLTSQISDSVVAVTIDTTDALRKMEEEPFQLSATVEKTGNASTAVTWTSTQTAVATINNSGLVTAIAEGESEFIATSVFDATKSARTKIQFYQQRTPINGGFELAQPVWGIYKNDVGSDANNETTIVKSGLSSYKVNNVGNYTTIWQGVEFGVENDLQKGDFVKASAYVYSPVANAGIKPRLMIETVSSGDAKNIIAFSPTELVSTANEWIKIETTVVKLPESALTFNVKLEFHELGQIYIDNIDVTKAESNDTTLEEITIDGEPLLTYSDQINEYNVLVTSLSDLPIVLATSNDSETVIVITPGTEANPTTTILITAKDQTIRTITVNFYVASIVDLLSISINSELISAFNPLRERYYQLLSRGTTVVPTITVEKINALAEVTITYPVSLPGNVTIDVSFEELDKVYMIYLDVIADNRLMIYYPDTNFERTSGTGLLQEWGYTGNQTFVVSTEQSHSGIQSVKVANDGSGGWMGVGFAESGNINYPAKGDVLKAGVWVYGLAQGDIVLEIYSKEAQGQIAVKIHTILPQDIGRWVYVETSPSTQVALNADYVQIVIKNYSLGSVYIDDISLFRVEN